MKLAVGWGWGGDVLERELNAQRIRMNDDKIRSLFLIFFFFYFYFFFNRHCGTQADRKKPAFVST